MQSEICRALRHAGFTAVALACLAGQVVARNARGCHPRNAGRGKGDLGHQRQKRQLPESGADVKASYRMLDDNMTSVMGDICITLDEVGEPGKVTGRGTGPELVISFTATVEHHGH